MCCDCFGNYFVGNKDNEQKKNKQNDLERGPTNSQISHYARSSIYKLTDIFYTEEQMPSKFQKLNRVLLIGKQGVGKTKLFSQIQGLSRKKYQNKQFSEVVIEEHSYIAVDTPAFEMENTIEERENTIKQFQDYLSKSKENVSTLAIVVNFERTDLMKKKVSEVYKFLHKFKGMIVLIVVGWELNDNPDVSEDSLRHSFRVYPCDMIFIRKDQDAVKAISEIVKSKPEQPMDLNNTIFEDFDPKALNIQEILGKYSLKIETDF